MVIELAKPFFYILTLTNVIVMGGTAAVLFANIWDGKYRSAVALHILMMVGMLTSFFVSMLLLMSAVVSEDGVVRLFG